MVLVSACAMFNYLLRASIGIVLIPLSEKMHWSRTEQGRFMSAFFMGYATLQLPGAWAAQKLGGKAVMLWSLLGWCTCTALLPVAAQMHTHLVFLCIFLLGVFESPIMPCISTLQSRWLLPAEYSRAAAMVAVGCTAGSIAANMVRCAARCG